MGKNLHEINLRICLLVAVYLRTVGAIDTELIGGRKSHPLHFFFLGGGGGELSILIGRVEAKIKINLGILRVEIGKAPST